MLVLPNLSSVYLWPPLFAWALVTGSFVATVFAMRPAHMLPVQVLLDHGMSTRASSRGYQDIQQESSSWPTVPAYGATVNAVIFNLGLHVVLKIEQVIPVDFAHLGEQKRTEFENSLVVRFFQKSVAV